MFVKITQVLRYVIFRLLFCLGASTIDQVEPIANELRVICSPGAKVILIIYSTTTTSY